MPTDFQNSFTDRLFTIYKCEIKSLLNIPPHLKHVATLPCEISMFRKFPCSKNWVKKAAMQDSATQNSCWKDSCSAMLALSFHWRKDIESGRTHNPTLWLTVYESVGERISKTSQHLANVCGQVHSRSLFWLTVYTASQKCTTFSLYNCYNFDTCKRVLIFWAEILLTK